MPNDAINGFRDSQNALLGDAIAGEIIWTAGSRDGVNGTVQKDCRTNSHHRLLHRPLRLAGRPRLARGPGGQRRLRRDEHDVERRVQEALSATRSRRRRSATSHPNCGPANKTCVDSKGNSDLTERDIERMADYARWVGNPTRSEFQVTLPEVVAGEKVFRKPEVRHLPRHQADRHHAGEHDADPGLPRPPRQAHRRAKGIKPFLSYIGTDLLMHDMGYLSQVGIVPAGQRSATPSTGVV